MIDPAEEGFSITPNDNVDLEKCTRAIYVGSDGNIKMTLAGGDVITLVGVIAGVVYPIRVRRVWSTNTTATNLIGLF